MIALSILISICYVINTIIAFLIYDRIVLVENKFKEIIENQNRIRESVNDIAIDLGTISAMVSDIEDSVCEL